MTNSGLANRMFTATATVLAVCAISQLTGCCNRVLPRACGTMVDNMFANYRECVWARRAYNLEYGTRWRPFADHFRRGFVEGYCNICEGGDGYVPAMPPRDYWGYEFQSEQGSQCVGAWFEGYPAGVAAARKARAGKHSDLYISRMIDAAVKQEQTGVRMASSVKITSPGAAVEVPAVPVSPPDDQAPPTPLEPAEPSMVIGRGSF